MFKLRFSECNPFVVKRLTRLMAEQDEKNHQKILRQQSIDQQKEESGAMSIPFKGGRAYLAPEVQKEVMDKCVLRKTPDGCFVFVPKNTEYEP